MYLHVVTYIAILCTNVYSGGLLSAPVVHHQTVSRSSSVSSATPGSPLYYFYRITSYLLLKTKQVSLKLIQLFWRFLELHLHKISMLVLFGVALSEVSAGYWVLLAVALLTIPLPYFNPIFYPLLTIYIGLVATLKTIYQFPIVKPDMFNLTNFNATDDDAQCYEPLVSCHCINNIHIILCQPPDSV